MNKESLNEKLSILHENLLRGIISPEEVVNELKEPDVMKSINAYINKVNINPLIPYFQEDLQNIFLIIQILQFIYNNTGIDSPISDSDYDKLYAIMLDNGGNDVVSAPIIANTTVVTHKYPTLRGSLDKIYYLSEDEKRTNPSRKYLDEWIRNAELKIFKLTGKKISLNDEEVYVFPKWDGVSGILEFNENNELERALTRGDVTTNEAVDITKMLSAHICKSKIKNTKYGLKTEVMMREDDLNKYNKKYNCNYKNTRSIVSSILNSKEIDDRVNYLVLQELRIKPDNGDEIIADNAFNDPYIKCKLSDRERIRKFALEHKYVDGLRCDGAVIYIINPEIQKILGREDNINKFEVAYKFTEEIEFSKVKDIKFTLGLFGNITPVATVKKVKLKGNTISNISLGSMGRFKDLKLAKGDKVKILYDIIPYLVFDDECERSGNEPFETPTLCPECLSELDNTESGELRCINPKCPCRQKGKILNFLNKMNIENISYATVDVLYDNDILKSIEDIYKLEDKVNELIKLDGFGSTSIYNIINEINSNINIPDYQLFGAIGIESVGLRIFEKIFDKYDIDEFMEICNTDDINKLTLVNGIKDKTANKIISGVKDNKKTIKYLMKKLNIINSKNKDKSNSFEVCFTKVRSTDLEKLIDDKGGKTVNNITKKTTLLIVPSLDIKSSKVDKAKKYGVEIIPIDKAEEYINNNF